MKYRAVIYARQSSGADDFSQSVEVQIANCRRLAAQQQISIVGVFSDLNISGKTYPAGWESLAAADHAFQKWMQHHNPTRSVRPGLGKVIEHLPAVNYVIVDDITRLYRPLSRSYLESAVNEILIENNVTILQVKGGLLDLAQFDQQLITMLKNQINDEQIAKQRLRSIEVLNRLRDSGIMPTGIKAYGLIYDRMSKSYSLDAEKAEVIKFIFDAVIRYESYSTIVHAVNRRWKHLFKSCFWEKSLHEIIRKPIYAGYQYNTAGDLIKNHQGPAVITLDKFLQAQDIVAAKRFRHARNKCNFSGENRHWLPLSGLLYCGNCRSRLVVAVDRGKISYYCRRGCLEHDLRCRTSRIALVCSKPYTVGLLDALQPLLAAALQQRAQKINELDNHQNKIAELQKAVFSTEQQLQNLCAEYCQGELPEHIYRRTLHKLNADLHQYRWQTMQFAAAGPEHALETARWQTMFSNYRKNTLSPGEYELLLRESISQVIVYSDHISIYMLAGAGKIWELPRKRILRQNGFSNHIVSRMRNRFIQCLQEQKELF